VVFLARKLGAWWTELPARLGPPIENLLYSADSSRPDLAVSPLAAPLERRKEIVANAAEVFRSLVGGGSDGDVPDLRDGVYEKPLYLHMAALAWLRGESMQQADDALRRTYEHETRYWRRRVAEEAPGYGVGQVPLEKAFVRALTGLTLVGGVSDKIAARELLARLEIGESLRDAVLRLLVQLYPGSGSGPEAKFLGPLMPDVLGEELVAQWLAEDLELLGLLLTQATNEEAEHCLTVLTRLAQRDAERGESLIRGAFEGRIDRLVKPGFAVALAIGDPLGHLMSEMMSEASDQTLEFLLIQFDKTTNREFVPLLELAVNSAEEKLERLRQSAHPQASDKKAEATELISVLGGYYYRLGRHQKGLEFNRRAVESYRELSRKNPQEFTRRLGIGLSNLSNSLFSDGAYQEARSTVTEAVKILEAQPQRYEPDLALALNNLGNILEALGLHSQALDITLSCVESYRRIALEGPDFQPELAGALINLGVRLDQNEFAVEAAQATREALGLFRQLAEARKDAYLTEIAKCCVNLGMNQFLHGDHKEAFDLYEEAERINRRLARQRPDAFRGDLAICLYNFGILYRGSGQTQQALATFEEAIQTLAPFFFERPERFGNHMARMFWDFTRLTQQNGGEPDAEFFNPILAKLEELGLVAISSPEE
jgi:tetratricopeptide (TPR) repeat protein